MYVQVNNSKDDNKKSVQRKKLSDSVNLTGLSANMKAKYENISGFSFDDVRVHYNSSKPAQLRALAYTQGNQIFVGPGQETHLDHELGHVVQQKQGRVVPTSYVNGIPVNDNSSLESEADTISFTPPSRIPAAALSSSSPTVQMLRKRVMGSGPVAQDHIFYDKSNDKYYHNITTALNQTATLKDDAEWQNYKKAKSKARSAQSIIAAETTANTFIDVDGFNTAEAQRAPSYSGTVFDVGTEMPSPPISVRLYAEGNFDHAVALADTMPEEKEFDKLMNLDPSMHRPETSTTPVLIKGTEYDTQRGLEKRYNVPRKVMYNPQFDKFRMKTWANYYHHPNQKNNFICGYLDFWNNNFQNYQYLINQGKYIDNIYQSGQNFGWQDYQPYWITIDDFTAIRAKLAAAAARPNLESSFGTNTPGGTGDLSRAPKAANPSKRQYDLIQSTFFWLPGPSSTVTKNALMLFLRNQYTKLKVNGVIRITLANRNSPNSQIYNQYRRTADEIVNETNSGNLKYQYECKLIELKNAAQQPSSYSKALEQKGLNPNEGFKHTRTDTAGTVDTTGGDLIIQARKLDESNPDDQNLLAGLEMRDLFEEI